MTVLVQLAHCGACARTVEGMLVDPLRTGRVVRLTREG